MLICLLYPVSIQFSIVILIFNVAVDADQHIAIFQNRGIGFLR